MKASVQQTHMITVVDLLLGQGMGRGEARGSGTYHRHEGGDWKHPYVLRSLIIS